MSDYTAGSNLEKVLKAGKFAFTGECGPPQGANLSKLKEKASHLKGCVDAVNITDNQTAIARLSSIASANPVIRLVAPGPDVVMTTPGFFEIRA